MKVAQRPGGKRTAKAAHDDVVATRGLGARRRRRATAVKRALKRMNAPLLRKRRSRAPRRGARSPPAARGRRERRRRFDDARARRVAIRANAHDDVPRDRARRSGRGARACRSSRRGARLAAYAARCRRAGGPPLSRKPRRSLLLLQDESLRAHPRRDPGHDCVGDEPRRPRRFPARPARGAGTRRRASVCRGRHRQGAACTRSPRTSASTISSAFPRSRALRAASRRGSRSRRRISHSSIRSRLGLRSDSGARRCFAAA